MKKRLPHTATGVRVYVMTTDEQSDFDPVKFVENLKRAGFRLDSDSCPVQFQRHWDRETLLDGTVIWRQWEH